MFSLHEGRLFILDWKVMLVSAERPQIWCAGATVSVSIQINSSHFSIPTCIIASSHYDHLLCSNAFLKHCHNNYKHLNKQKPPRNESLCVMRINKRVVPQGDEPMHTLTKVDVEQPSDNKAASFIWWLFATCRGSKIWSVNAGPDTSACFCHTPSRTNRNLVKRLN